MLLENDTLSGKNLLNSCYLRKGFDKLFLHLRKCSHHSHPPHSPKPCPSLNTAWHHPAFEDNSLQSWDRNKYSPGVSHENKCLSYASRPVLNTKPQGQGRMHAFFSKFAFISLRVILKTKREYFMIGTIHKIRNPRSMMQEHYTVKRRIFKT